MPTLLDLVEPIVPEWSVGTLAVAWDDTNDRMVLVAEELLTEEEQEVATDVARARFLLTAGAGRRVRRPGPGARRRWSAAVSVVRGPTRS